jgi:beta-lactamase class A
MPPMATMITRRTALAATASLIPLLRASATNTAKNDRISAAQPRLAALEARIGGRLGVGVLDTADDALLGYRADERFPMSSTCNVLAVASVLKRVDEGQEQPDRLVPYKASDLAQGDAPVTTAHLRAGGMMVLDLCAAAIQWSDETAANLLLRSVGGPAGVTRYLRSLGDAVTRLDRAEPGSGEAAPVDGRRTTSPEAMVRDLRRILLSRGLTQPQRLYIWSWMLEGKLGGQRLRAGIPASWQIGDQTGTARHGTVNVVAFLMPPRRPPLLAAIYMAEAKAPAAVCDAAHAAVGRIIVDTL